MKKNSLEALSVLSLSMVMQAAFAGNITDINVSVLPDQQRVIKLKFDSVPVEPTGFTTATPARIALDFPGTSVKVPQAALSFNDALLNQIIAAQNDNNARILLGLAKEGQYNAQVRGNEVWIYVSESKSTNTATVHQASAADNSAANYTPAAATSGFNVDFRKGGQNSGLVEFSSAYTGQPQVKVQSDRLVITLKNYPLATQDQRNFDVTDFSTPVRTVTVKRIGNDTQITIRNQGSWEHKVTQSNGRHVIQVLPTRNVAESAANGKRAQQNFTGKRISLDFQNIEVRTVLQILAQESGMNIVASDSVQGKMTLSLKDVPWDQALDLVMDARNLDMRKHGNIINIAPRQELLDKDRNEAKARREMEDLGALYSKTFQLKYKNVEEFKNILRLSDSPNTNDRSNILSTRGSALIDPATNTLIVTDNQSVIQKFERLIDELDVPAKQVMVEARIVEAADGVSRSLGVKFGARRNGATSWGGDWNNSIALNNRSTNSGTSTGGVAFNPNVNLPVASATSSISVIHSWAAGALGLELSAMETENLTKTISTPRVLTQDRKEAEIRQGTQIPYTTRSSDGDSSTAFKDAVLSLKVTPRITPDSKIILDIAINKDEPDYNNVNAEGEPGIVTRAVKTQAMIEDGATLVVGGIYQEQMANNVSKVPLLGDIPVLGNLFKSRSRSRSRNELLFFITPRIMGAESSVLRY
ncbi:type IV pilus secretin PilQ [Kingella kingae]|uniref:type IV pilus secretin PilQ n=1 Tax=Kingella kingae TaxID=504 RepID=UPI000427D302|nr:type IV pilus secretin PilQ [Kingella kingae]MDK4563471.1 type IV pilus secretin PilQ [Kingella kingae]MDK4577799.1 type IV pilus secretin PilQ [Kingella kingae]MDK4608288.1 type IV pilus secretin PilQ [Kingella kingae]MDK4626545.1 type IV pilus secretin PilQ [Kingella kingae]MDK4674055.1 type IV pilus secretin PilQ [Kingella kingae]